jgi:precorrin-6A/cobalt-precorrin-6A reductase
VALLALRRPPWVPHDGDRWTEVTDVEAAVRALDPSPRRVFLALGRNEIGCFAQAPQHLYLVRSVDPVDPPLAVPRASYVTGRGPFTEADDRDLLSAHAIDIVVAKNSGGTATYGKIAAARALGLTVILLRRPALPEAPTVETVEDAMTWLDHARALPSERGV